MPIYQKHTEDSERVTCFMLAFMSLNLQNLYEYIDAHTIISHLKEMFEELNCVEQYKISK
uniref:Uncharacterized protein n=1 Tax=Manihot esculenta TaxID=3983 RepID=A0A2C9VFD5_MANES